MAGRGRSSNPVLSDRQWLQTSLQTRKTDEAGVVAGDENGSATREKEAHINHQQSLHGETAARRQAITELLFFASVGDVYRCKKIVSAWNLNLKDPRTADYDKRTPLHLAAAEGCYSSVAWLISHEVDVNPVDRFKRTPLEDAVRGDHGEVVQLLVQHGAKVLLGKTGELVELADSPLAGNVRIFTDYDPEWEVDPSALHMGEKIGEGEFGVVHKAIWHGTVVAVKVLKETGAVALGDFRTELNVLQKVHHPHTVQFLGAVTKTEPFMIVTEYMTGGSLTDLFKAHKLPSLWRSVQLALDCARGLAYLHSRQPLAVIHRDLKPANLMIGGPKVFNPYHRTLCENEMGVLKIADFGLSKSLKMPNKRHNKGRNSIDMGSSRANGNSSGQITSGGDSGSNTPSNGENGDPNPAYKMTGETGSYRYMAPEVFRHELYNNKVDVYSWAMIAYQLFEGLPPFWTMGPVDAARAAALENKRPIWNEYNRIGERVPDNLKRLVEACWAANYESRPEFDEIVSVLEELGDALHPELTSGTATGGCCSVQ